MYNMVEPQPGIGNHGATSGQIWMCTICGKKSRWKYGFVSNGQSCIYVDKSGIPFADPGWDESCMLNSVLYEIVED